MFYFVTFIATKKNYPCNQDCENVVNFNNSIRKGREAYVVGAHRCSANPVSDTLCVFLNDTIGINIPLFADTACMLAVQNGLLRQKIIIMKNFSSPIDTLIKKDCP